MYSSAVSGIINMCQINLSDCAWFLVYCVWIDATTPNAALLYARVCLRARVCVYAHTFFRLHKAMRKLGARK